MRLSARAGRGIETKLKRREQRTGPTIAILTGRFSLTCRQKAAHIPGPEERAGWVV
jgi:hypothetical protein